MQQLSDFKVGDKVLLVRQPVYENVRYLAAHKQCVKTISFIEDRKIRFAEYNTNNCYDGVNYYTFYVESEKPVLFIQTRRPKRNLAFCIIKVVE